MASRHALLLFSPTATAALSLAETLGLTEARRVEVRPTRAEALGLAEALLLLAPPDRQARWAPRWLLDVDVSPDVSPTPPFTIVIEETLELD